MKKQTRNPALLPILVTLSVAACGESTTATPDAGTDAAPATPLQVATWWTSPSETEALQRFIGAFRGATPGAQVELVKVKNDRADRKASYLTTDWDIGQEVWSFIDDHFARPDGTYAALDLRTIPELTSVLGTIAATFLERVTVKGQLLGFAVGAHRENTLHYAVSYTTTPPKTLAELRATCDAFVAGGKMGPKPLALAAQDWIVRILFAAMLPPDVLKGQAADPLPAITAATEVIEHFTKNDCFHTASSWDAAAQSVIDGKAGMYIHGDWARGYMIQSGWRAGTDFNVAPAPGSNSAYQYGVDSFVINRNSSRRALAIGFAKAALSPAAQIAFSQVKGSAPIVKIDNPDTQITDPALRATYKQLVEAQQAGTFVPVPGWVVDNAKLLMPLLDGTKAAAQVAQDVRGFYP